MKRKAVVYINQMFGQIGGEEMADVPPEIREGTIGPALLYQNLLAPDIEVTHTIICGDNYMGSHMQEALGTINDLLKDKSFDVFFAGPAFMAGRYGLACGNVCKFIQEKFRVPVFTSMNVENPGVEMFRKEIYIFKGGKTARDMRKNVQSVCTYARKYLYSGELLSAEEEGYFGRGIRKAVYHGRLNSDRAVDMLLDKLSNKPFKTELTMNSNDLPTPAKAVKDLSKARIAMITTGGIVPLDNPDRIQSSSAMVWGKYSIEKMDRLKKGEFICIHAGFDNYLANENPNIVVPLDVMRAMEREGIFKELYPYFYTTTGTGTAQAMAVKMSREILDDMRREEIDAAILTST